MKNNDHQGTMPFQSQERLGLTLLDRENEQAELSDMPLPYRLVPEMMYLSYYILSFDWKSLHTPTYIL